MNAYRISIFVFVAAGLMAGEAEAQFRPGHDQYGGFSRVAAVPRLARAIGPMCIVLPETLPDAGRDVVIGVVEGTVPPTALESVLAAGGAREAARDLSQALVGVGTAPRQGQYEDAIRHFNALVRGSSSEFLLNPPQEFLAVHEIVRYLSTGAPPAAQWVCPVFRPTEPPPVVTPPAERLLEVCVMIDDDLRIITATFRPETGDTLLDGVPFRQAHPLVAPDYAAAAPWFAQSDSLQFGGQLYVRFGLERRLMPGDVERVGDHLGTAVFAEAGSEPPHPSLLLPVRPGCVFQPYQRREALRPRG
jgi:hypothetical protein